VVVGKRRARTGVCFLVLLFACVLMVPPSVLAVLTFRHMNDERATANLQTTIMRRDAQLRGATRQLMAKLRTLSDPDAVFPGSAERMEEELEALEKCVSSKKKKKTCRTFLL